MRSMFRSVVLVAWTGVLALTAVANAGDPYGALLSNPRVTDAIETNPYIEPGTYLDFLLMKIDQLETGQTQSWGDYRHPEPHTDQEIAEVILQKVALSLYIEAHQLVPWSLLDYNEESLRVVLGDAFSELRNPPYWEVRILFNSNPLVPYNYARDLRILYPGHPIETPKDLLDLTIIKMRDDGWTHGGSDPDAYPNACAEIGYIGFVDFECAELFKKGASGLTPVFIYSVLHTQNVPSRMIEWFGHGGIEFPSLGIGMDGDGVYSGLGGFTLRPNYLPVDITYLELPLYEKWMDLEYCEGNAQQARHIVLQYLGLLDDTGWNADILATYCRRRSNGYTGAYYVPGDYLRYMFIDGVRNVFCQNDDPEGENYQAPALTEEELDQWMAAIAEWPTECGPCQTDADCDDGDWCNGNEHCDEYGYCAPVLLGAYPLCDDGLPCTTERCWESACEDYCNWNGVVYCKPIYVRDAPDCDDGLMCTQDRCADNACAYTPADYGDVNEDGLVDLQDILCVLDGFGGQFNCPPESIDIANCTADGTIDVSDILAILDAFAGDDPCCGGY